MPGEIDGIRSHLNDLGERINARREELQREGILHGKAREEAAELQIKHASALRKAMDHPSVGEAISDELKSDVQILNHTFERWLARLDKKSEQARKS
jgi:hypothetical protein